jgi:phage baseplate assembly protein V
MDMQTMTARMMAPLARRLRLMVARAVVTAIGDAGKVQSAQVKLLDGEVRDGIEMLHQYGFTSNPHGKMEGLYFSVGGDRDHGVLICVADRQFRLKSIAPGEVALYDDLDQKVHLTRAGIVIEGGELPITIQNTPQIDMVTPLVNMSGNLHVVGNIVADGDISDHGNKSMLGMRSAYNGHHHNETGTVTAVPNQGM